MYYILYGFLYTLSLLPWKVLYFLSDCVYVLVYYILGYRKEVVMKNLNIAFPEKTDKERVRIAKDFYHHFFDNFIEMVKFLSLSDKAFSKRLTGNFEVLSDLYPTGQNIQIHSAHFFNIEYMNWGIPKYSGYPFIGVYIPQSKALNKIILDMRKRYGSIMMSASEFKSSFHQHVKKKYALGLAADQRPATPVSGNWLKFFGKLSPFLTGPEKSARIYNNAVVFVHYYPVKRGYYHADFKLITTTPKEFARGEITKMYVAYLEECIRKEPANYLWSHKRWKWEFSEEYRKLVIE